MKKLALYLTSSLCLMNASQAADLIVNIDHIEDNNGKIYAETFMGQENYDNGNVAGYAMLNAKAGPAKLVFKGLKPGEYVVRIYHDQNNNQELDTNMFGMPLEGFAFSNEAEPNFGPPNYKDMIVIIKSDDEKVTTKAKMFYL